MGAFVIGSLLGWAALLGLFGVFDGNGPDDGDDGDPDPDPVGVTIDGTDGGDDLTVDGRDTLEGLGGDDTLDGRGHSVIFGGAGGDAIDVQGAAEGHGGEDSDTLTGSGESQLYGGKGNDSFFTSGSVTAFGDADDDFMNGSDDATLYGGDGADDMDGSGNANLYGGAGNDEMGGYLFISEAATLDAVLMDGGEGDDLIRHLSADEIQGASTLLGGAGNDRLYSDIATDSLDGGDGKDILCGANGVSLTGDAGRDIFEIPSDQAIDGAGATVITDFSLMDDQLAIYLPPGEWLAGMEITKAVVGGNTVIRFSFDQNAPGYPGERGSAPEDFAVVLEGITDPESINLNFATSPQYEAGVVLGSYGIVQGTDAADTLTANGNFDVLGGEGDDVIDMGAAGNAAGGAGDDVIIRNVTTADGPVANISGTYGGDGDDIIVLGAEGNNASADGGRSFATYGGAGNDVFMIDPAGFEDGVYVEIRDYTAGDEIVILADPAEVVSAEWSAVVVDEYSSLYRYYLEVQMADGSSLTLKLPADADFDPDNPPTFPVTFDANAADGLAA